LQKGHTGKFSCEACVVSGTRNIKHSTTLFPYEAGGAAGRTYTSCHLQDKRTHEGVLRMVDKIVNEGVRDPNETEGDKPTSSLAEVWLTM